MGWSNYIIISEWKLAVEISRNVNELEYYIINALDNIMDEEYIEDIDDIDIVNMKLNDLTVGNLAILLNAYTNMSDLVSIEPDKLFLYWLKCRNINYKILSEYNVDIGELKGQGYNIIRKN